MIRAVFLVQLALVGLCVAVLGSIAINWPYPNAFVRQVLPPRIAYPTEQIMSWVENGDYNPAFLRFFNRDPERAVPPGDNYVAPADGQVKYILAQDGTTYFVTGLSYWDVHVVRSPVAGTVRSIVTKGVTVYRDEASTHDLAFLREKGMPVQAIITINTAHGPIVVRMITSWWASRLKLRVFEGEHVAKGQRLGRILLGSAVTVDVPGPARFRVRAHARVVAGETVIAVGGDLG